MSITTPAERTCRAWRVYWGQRILAAYWSGDEAAFSDALAARAEWDA